MIPLHKQIQKYEAKLAKIEEREEKRAKAAKKNAGKADRKKPPIDRELSLAEAGVRSSLRDGGVRMVGAVCCFSQADRAAGPSRQY
jgi:hypothetical protein